VQALVATARDCLGEIDIYCSNAGIAIGAGPDAPDEAWQQSWDVNLMAHVRAARELLPAWLERGRGCFVVTASAAGLLTMLGTATYSVTKHAAESYAEWLAATYGHRGLVVHCICPQGCGRTDAGRVGRGREGGAAGRGDRARAGRRGAARGLASARSSSCRTRRCTGTTRCGRPTRTGGCAG
jgi:NAD(P)-dependent dehydrogenase (short-subunit alcohol dehydrogenase family)